MNTKFPFFRRLENFLISLGLAANLVVNDAWWIGQIERVVDAIDWRHVREDGRRFIKPHAVASLERWSREFFLQQCRKIGPAR
ncbi:MAG: hypothetical protein EXS37_09770 [Opitutus sp.]|nr:hypothetical protein [Opitutus sp.]